MQATVCMEPWCCRAIPAARSESAADGMHAPWHRVIPDLGGFFFRGIIICMHSVVSACVHMQPSRAMASITIAVALVGFCMLARGRCDLYLRLRSVARRLTASLYMLHRHGQDFHALPLHFCAPMLANAFAKLGGKLPV